MKRRMYTRSFAPEILEKIGNRSAQFTADESAYAVEKAFSDIFKTRESLLGWYIAGDANKISELSLLISHIKNGKFMNILSLGAGSCVLEYFIKCALPKDKAVVAADFNKYYIEKAQEFLPGIIPIEFDFFKDDVKSLQTALGMRFDLVIFFGATYVMDDITFVRFLKELKEAGVKEIIDFYAGYMDLPDVIRAAMLPVTKNPVIRKMFGKPAIPKQILEKFHGYSRSRSELRKLYKSAGFALNREMRSKCYKYIAICEPLP